MNAKTKTKRPRFKSEAEERRFWETHDAVSITDQGVARRKALRLTVPARRICHHNSTSQRAQGLNRMWAQFAVDRANRRLSSDPDSWPAANSIDP